MPSLQRTFFDDSARYIVRDKRWGFRLKCNICKFRYSCGGKKSLRHANQICTEIKEDHLRCCPDATFEIQSDFHAAELPHDDVVQTTNQSTTSSSYTDVSGASISSSSFTAGRKYLIYVTAAIGGTVNSDVDAYQVLHGSTAFASSEHIGEPYDDNSGITRYYYGWFTVWTAVSSEGIKMQFKKDSGSGSTQIDNIHIAALEISEDLTENTDWYSNETATEDTLDTTFGDTNDASITVSSGADEIWWVSAYSRIRALDTGDQTESRINRDSGADVAPLISTEGEDTNGKRTQLMTNVYKLSSGSHTFKQESRHDAGSAPVRTHSGIFAIRLDQFDVHTTEAAYNEAEISPDTNNSFATSPVQALTASIQPNTTGDVFCIGYMVYDINSTIKSRARMQVDNSDQPATQTSDFYEIYRWDSTDELPVVFSEIVNLDTTSHNIDMDVTSTDTIPKFEDRMIVAFTLELAGGGGSSLIKIANDTISISESANQVMSLVRTHNDTVNITESTNLAMTLVRNIADTVNISENVNRLKTIGAKVINETVSISEAHNRALGFVKVVNDTLNISEAFNRVLESGGNLIRIINDTISISDANNRTRSLSRTISETVNVSEIHNRTRILVRTISDTINIVEVSSIVKGLAKVINDTINIAETTVKKIAAAVSVIRGGSDVVVLKRGQDVEII